MKQSRRIEITVFRRRITIVTGAGTADPASTEIILNDPDSDESIQPASTEGRKILEEAVNIIERHLSGRVE